MSSLSFSKNYVTISSLEALHSSVFQITNILYIHELQMVQKIFRFSSQSEPALLSVSPKWNTQPHSYQFDRHSNGFIPISSLFIGVLYHWFLNRIYSFKIEVYGYFSIYKIRLFYTNIFHIYT